MEHILRFGAVAIGLLLLGGGCQSQDGGAPSSHAEEIDSPAGPGSGQPRLYDAADGTIWMSWLESMEEGGHALRYATLTEMSWGEPNTVATGENWFVNWADLPSVRPLSDGRIAAHYLASNGPGALAYEVRLVQTAGGAWQEPIVPHRDGTQTEHGFVSLLPWHSGQLLAVWLDGRKMADGNAGHGEGEMTLRGAVLDSTGTVDHRAEIDGRTCECCATSAVRVGNEALVAYRDRSEDETRDIRLARFDGKRWSDPTLVHADGWQIEGCPVNGPVLAVQGERVVAAWFTAAGGQPRVHVAFSSDAGRSFSEPTVVADGATKGRVDVVLLDDGSAVVTWLAQGGEGGTIRAQTVHADGHKDRSTVLITVPSTARGIGFPKMVRRNDDLYVSWVGTADGSEAAQVRVARVPISAVE